jgi:hypothetical protein
MSETEIPTETNYVPMADSFAAEEPKKKEYNAEQDGLKAAAAEVVEARESNAPPQTDKTRVYQNLATGEQLPEHLTVTPERAGRDVKMMREWEAQTEQPQRDLAQLQNVADNMRQAFPNKELPPTFVQDLQQYSEQAKQQQSSPEPQPQASEQVQPQPAEQPALPDIDPEIAQALQNPKIRSALEAEVMAAENARQQYAQGVRQAAQLSAASLLASFPEIANVPSDQLQTAISVIAASNPQRAQAIMAHLQRTQQLFNASVAAQQAQQQLQAQRIQEYARAEDARFEQTIANESQETKRAVLDNGARVLRQYYDVDAKAFAEAIQNTPALRSAPVQRMLFDLIKTKVAQENIPSKLDRSVPPVQRPGVSQPRGDDSGVTAAMKAFKADPSPKSAAALLMARRAANSRR